MKHMRRAIISMAFFSSMYAVQISVQELKKIAHKKISPSIDLEKCENELDQSVASKKNRKKKFARKALMNAKARKQQYYRNQRFQSSWSENLQHQKNDIVRSQILQP